MELTNKYYDRSYSRKRHKYRFADIRFRWDVGKPIGELRIIRSNDAHFCIRNDLNLHHAICYIQVLMYWAYPYTNVLSVSISWESSPHTRAARRPHCHFLFCSNVTCQKLYYFMMRTPIPCLYLQRKWTGSSRKNQCFILTSYLSILFVSTHLPSKTYDTMVILVKLLHSTDMR